MVIIAVLFFAVGALGSGKSSGSKSSKSSSISASTVGGGGGGWIGGVGPLFVNTGFGTNTVTHEVVREVPVAPSAPQPITCPNCGRAYMPAENHFACPNCGAPTPPEFMEASGSAAQG